MIEKKIMSLFILAIILAIVGCGGSSETKENPPSNKFEKIALSQSCTVPDVIDEYMTLKKGDKIIKDEEITQISIFHDENNLKRVCLKSGKAHILRLL